MSLIESISVIIPVYNAEKYLGEAVESVLNQTVMPLEIILVDDGSTDQSTDIAKNYFPDVYLITQENKGGAGARNTGIRHSKGDLLAFLDDDDIWPPDHLEKLLALLKTRKELHLAFGHVQQFVSGEIESLSHRIPEGHEIMPGYVAGASLTKKVVFDEVGLFNEDLVLAEYIDWFSRAKDAGFLFDIIDDVVLKRRIHGNNIGITKRDHRIDYIKVLKQSINRKRENKKNDI